MKRPQRLFLRKTAEVPNSKLPVLLYRSVLARTAGDKAVKFRRRFAQNGWTGLWTDTIFDYTHFHSNAHEALGIAEGRATVELGGAGGRRCRLRAGDMLVLPAGVGHRRLGSDEGLKVIGAYPPGQSHYTMKRPGRTRIHAQPRIALPPTDPFYGEDGPLTALWNGNKREPAGFAGQHNLKKEPKMAEKKPKTKAGKKRKTHKVMEEYKEGKLKSGKGGKGGKVKSRKQAIAIAMSESGQSKKKSSRKKSSAKKSTRKKSSKKKSSRKK